MTATDEHELRRAIALARELLHRSGALRVSVALDAPRPAIVECERLRAIAVHDADGARELPHDAAGDIELPALPLLRRLPPFDVDPAEGRVAGALGGLEMLGRAVREIAAMLPGRSVVAADYETRDADVPLGLAGRAGEPLVVLLGEHEFALDVDRPDA
ncbi:MAG TPA: hypothetical protein VG474_03540 [Solirubrobacteraceae bacterium]|nr:hypothetical protein [Solirubrobacteraceae bacterium]